MEPLTTYQKNGYHFHLIKREGNLAIFAQCRRKNGKPSAFEIIKIKHMPAGVICGNPVPERETSPSNEEWGHLGWTANTIEYAEEIFNEVLAEIKAKQ